MLQAYKLSQHPYFILISLSLSLSLVFVGGVVIDCIQALVSAFLLDDSAEDMDEGCLSGPLGN